MQMANFLFRILQIFFLAHLAPVPNAFAGATAEQVVACTEAPLECCDFPAPGPAANVAAPSIGVHVWPSALAENPATVERLVSMHPAHLRFSFGPDWRRQPPLRQDMEDDELDAAVAAGYGRVPGLAGEVEVLQNIRRRIQAVNHLVVWEPPPLPGEADLSKSDAPRLRTLKADSIPLVARFHVANLRYLSGIGLPIDAVELSNEPDGRWNIRILPPDYLSLVEAVRKEAARRGVALPKIYGPGASTVAATRKFLEDKDIAQRILRAVDVLSLHVWDDKGGKNRFSELTRFFTYLEKLGLRPQIAVTEYGLARPILDARQDRMNVDKRVAGSIASSPAYPAASIGDLAQLYANRIGPVLYWQFQDQSWGKGLFGLLDVAGEPKPIYEPYRMFAETLAKARTKSIESAYGGRVSVLRGPADANILLVNPDSAPIDVVVPDEAETPSSATTCTGGSGMTGIRVPAGAVMSLPLVRQQP